MRKDFAKQCDNWRKDKERLIIVMDSNKPTMDGPLRRLVEAEGVELVDTRVLEETEKTKNIKNGYVRFSRISSRQATGRV